MACYGKRRTSSSSSYQDTTSSDLFDEMMETPVNPKPCPPTVPLKGKSNVRLSSRKQYTRKVPYSRSAITYSFSPHSSIKKNNLSLNKPCRSEAMPTTTPIALSDSPSVDSSCISTEGSSSRNERVINNLHPSTNKRINKSAPPSRKRVKNSSTRSKKVNDPPLNSVTAISIPSRKELNIFDFDEDDCNDNNHIKSTNSSIKSITHISTLRPMGGIKSKVGVARTTGTGSNCSRTSTKPHLSRVKVEKSTLTLKNSSPVGDDAFVFSDPATTASSKIEFQTSSKSDSNSGSSNAAQVKPKYRKRKALPAKIQSKKLAQLTKDVSSGHEEPLDDNLDSDKHLLKKIDTFLEEGTSTANLLDGSNYSDKRPLVRKSTSDSTSHSSGRTYLTRPLNSPVEPVQNIPNLVKSSSWSHRLSRGRKVGVVRGDKKLFTVVQNVREAHQCLEIGENRQFFEETLYLLDNIKPSQPLNVRCLGTCNLATHYMDSDFSRQLRAHSYTNRITALLADCLQYPALCLSASVLFYVMTRDKLNHEWDQIGTKLLVGMLDSPDVTGRELTGKAAREMARIRTRASSILEKVADKTSQGIDTPPPEDEDDELPLSQPPKKARQEEEASNTTPCGFRVATDDICVGELARECLISLTSPQNNPQWLRDELRTQGGLDRLANMVISSCDELAGVDCSGLGTSLCDYSKSILRRAQVLERQLKSLENLTLMNRTNQSYLVVFDGSLLISKLIELLGAGHRLLSYEVLRPQGQNCLLAVLKVLLNLTHESELGSHRVSEQKGVMENIFRVILQLPDSMETGDQFDISVLALGLFINLTENSTINCGLLESAAVNHMTQQLGDSQGTQADSDDVMCDDIIQHRVEQTSSVRALVSLFLKHHSRADSVDINVPTPQRLSQLSNSQSSSSYYPPKGTSSCKVNLTERLSNRYHSLPQLSGAKVGVATSKVEEEGEEFEKIEMDPLVFDREEFNTALDQAGQHMQDSILSSYTALLLGILAEHNNDSVDLIRSLMPSGSFSEMMAVLREFVSFMNITGSVTGLEGIRHTIKFLEAL